MKILLTILCLLSSLSVSANDSVQDPDYGAVLFQFYQGNYFDSLVEFELADLHGGIDGHGQYPELVKGGVNLSFGMEKRARTIFEQNLSELATAATTNRAWLFIARIHYERGDQAQAASTWRNIQPPIERDLEAEATYLGTLIALQNGDYQQAINISDNIPSDKTYSPFVAFNAGLSHIKLGNTNLAIEKFQQTIKLAAKNKENRWALSDQSYLALAQLYNQTGELELSDEALTNVRANGPYAKPAILNQAWTLTSREDYANALALTHKLSEYSVAYPETQEALLLSAHIYENIELTGRALLAFNTAASRYKEGFKNIEILQASLHNSDLLTALVDDLEQTVQETDWFGEAPLLESNVITPFLYQLMATNRFQSLLKDLRDLYAIRLNLQQWQDRRPEFDLMFQAQSRVQAGQTFNDRVSNADQSIAEQELWISDLELKTDQLNKEQQEQANAALAQIRQNLEEAKARMAGISGQNFKPEASTVYEAKINAHFARLTQKLEETEQTIIQLETVILDTIEAYLGRQISRLRLYEVQARLARARLLDMELVKKYSYQTPEYQDLEAAQ